MPLSRAEEQLLRIGKANSRLLVTFREGIHLEQSSSRTIDDLRDQACADRVSFAEGLVDRGDRMLRSRPPMYRDAISRYYYSMYHGMRAVVYYMNDGDDHEKHEALPKHTPADFPAAAVWENRIKDARVRRNEADYDPYPSRPGDFRAVATALQVEARDLLGLIRTYLRGKGCGYL